MLQFFSPHKEFPFWDTPRDVANTSVWGKVHRMVIPRVATHPWCSLCLTYRGVTKLIFLPQVVRYRGHIALASAWIMNQK